MFCRKAVLRNFSVYEKKQFQWILLDKLGIKTLLSETSSQMLFLSFARVFRAALYRVPYWTTSASLHFLKKILIKGIKSLSSPVTVLSGLTSQSLWFRMKIKTIGEGINIVII